MLAAGMAAAGAAEAAVAARGSGDAVASRRRRRHRRRDRPRQRRAHLQRRRRRTGLPRRPAPRSSPRPDPGPSAASRAARPAAPTASVGADSAGCFEPRRAADAGRQPRQPDRRSADAAGSDRIGRIRVAAGSATSRLLATGTAERHRSGPGAATRFACRAASRPERVRPVQVRAFRAVRDGRADAANPSRPAAIRQSKRPTAEDPRGLIRFMVGACTGSGGPAAR